MSEPVRAPKSVPVTACKWGDDGWYVDGQPGAFPSMDAVADWTRRNFPGRGVRFMRDGRPYQLWNWVEDETPETAEEAEFWATVARLGKRLGITNPVQIVRSESAS